MRAWRPPCALHIPMRISHGSYCMIVIIGPERVRCPGFWPKALHVGAIELRVACVYLERDISIE